jgi:hypothetical protein
MPGPTKDPSVSQEPQSFTKLTVQQLKEFLKARGVRSSGKKCELVKLATLYAKSPVLRAKESQPGRSDIFANSELVWQEVTHHSQVSVPSAFSIDVLTTYLATVPVSLVMPQSEEGAGGVDTNDMVGGTEEVEMDAGTDKPSVKGRRMYVSEKLTLVEAANSGTDLLFRSNCEASMKKSCRYPAVAISQDGSVAMGQCNCPANAGLSKFLLSQVLSQSIYMFQLISRWSLCTCGMSTFFCGGHLYQTASSPSSSMHFQTTGLGSGQPSTAKTWSHLREEVIFLLDCHLFTSRTHGILFEAGHY